MNTYNPYAPSKASLGSANDKAPLGNDVSVWRDGKAVVMLPDASLPPRCVKCNAPADQPTRQRTLYWMNPALYLLFFVGVLILLIVYMIVRKQADVNPGLCRVHKRRRLIAQLYGFFGFFGGLVLAAVGADLDSPALLVLGIAMSLSAIVVAIAWGRLIHVKRISKDEVRLGGFCAEYLDSLPYEPLSRPRSTRRA